MLSRAMSATKPDAATVSVDVARKLDTRNLLRVAPEGASPTSCCRSGAIPGRLHELAAAVDKSAGVVEGGADK